MIAKQSLKPELALFFRIHFSASSRDPQPAGFLTRTSEIGRTNTVEDNWMEAGFSPDEPPLSVGTRHHPGDYLRTRSPNEPLGNY
jgi:hypothetical protein